MNQRVLIEKNYLRIPIRKDAVEKNVWLYQELTAVLQFQAGLFVDYGSGAPDFYAELPDRVRMLTWMSVKREEKV